MVVVVIEKSSDSAPDFDPAEIRARMLEAFPEIVFDPEEQARKQLERGQRLGAPEHILRSFERHVREVAPAYAFEMTLDHTAVRGTVRRIDVTFLLGKNPQPEVRERLVAFASQLGIGTVRIFE